MKIGIQISSDLKRRTGVGGYIYQLLKHLPMVDDFKNHQFFLFTPSEVEGLPVKVLKWPLKFGWTQIRLSLEMLKNPPDILFVPAHTFPLIHPRLIVTIQGLEFERVPLAHSWWQKRKLRYLTKRNAKKAEKIIVPSECTKRDLIELYGINPKKIFVIPHGVSKYEIRTTRYELPDKYILYLGSEYKRKNIDGLEKAFKILKEKYKIPHELILAGVKDYVNEKEKWELLKNADVFVYPSFYEGFGFPVLETQKSGVPVVASNVSSLPEILGDSALLVNPYNPEEIAQAIYKIIRDEKLREELIKKGYENVKRFSWIKCAEETLKIISQD